MTRRDLALLALIVLTLTGFLILAPAGKTLDRLNQEGIRSDVGDAIREKYAYSSGIQRAATQLAQAFQKAIDRPEDAQAINLEVSRATSCLRGYAEKDDVDQEDEIGVEIESLVVNTWARSRSYLKYNGRLSGGTYLVDYADLSKCDFVSK